MVEEIVREGLITPLFEKLFGYGVLGLYSILATYVAARLYNRQTVLSERLIRKEKTKRDEEQKIVDELLELSKNLITVSDALGEQLRKADEQVAKGRR